MHGAAIGQLYVVLPRLDAPAARVFGARVGMGCLLPHRSHTRIVGLFGEEQSMPDKRVGCFCAPQNKIRKPWRPLRRAAYAPTYHPIACQAWRHVGALVFRGRKRL